MTSAGPAAVLAVTEAGRVAAPAAAGYRDRGPGAARGPGAQPRSLLSHLQSRHGYNYIKMFLSIFFIRKGSRAYMRGVENLDRVSCVISEHLRPRTPRDLEIEISLKD